MTTELEQTWECPKCGRVNKIYPYPTRCSRCGYLHSEKVIKRYKGPYLANWQYGGYSYIEEDPTKPESLWPHGMVDYVDPEEVIAIAEREGLPTISLAGGFWERIGYKGWGEKLSISEARTALAKAREHILGRSTAHEQHSNPGDQQVTGKIDKLRGELEDLRDEAFNRHRGVTLSDWVTSPESPGIVINEERAKATACKCFTYKGKDYCYSPGIIGMLEAEQVPNYCPTKEYEVRPGIKQRFEEFADAAEAAHKKIEKIPKGERLIPWLTEMGKELRTRSVEV